METSGFLARLRAKPLYRRTAPGRGEIGATPPFIAEEKDESWRPSGRGPRCVIEGMNTFDRARITPVGIREWAATLKCIDAFQSGETSVVSTSWTDLVDRREFQISGRRAY